MSKTLASALPNDSLLARTDNPFRSQCHINALKAGTCFCMVPYLSLSVVSLLKSKS
jgi:hypothetical protein